MVGFPGGSDGKESTCSMGNPGSISVRERACNPLQYSCLEKPYGPRSLAGYSP